MIAAGLGQLRQGHFGFLFAALPERLYLGQVDGQVVRREGQHARRAEPRLVVNERAVRQPQNDDVLVVSREELAVFGGDRERFAAALPRHDENPGQIAPLVGAFVDPQGHVLAQPVELADLDRRTQRARTEFEPQLLIGETRDWLDIADNA